VLHIYIYIYDISSLRVKRYLEGSGKGASFFARALLGVLFFGDPEGYGEESSGGGHNRSPGILSDI